LAQLIGWAFCKKHCTFCASKNAGFFITLFVIPRKRMMTKKIIDKLLNPFVIVILGLTLFNIFRNEASQWGLILLIHFIFLIGAWVFAIINPSFYIKKVELLPEQIRLEITKNFSKQTEERIINPKLIKTFRFSSKTDASFHSVVIKYQNDQGLFEKIDLRTLDDKVFIDIIGKIQKELT
jgi:hypothetical protein